MNAAPAFVESRPIAPKPARPTRENTDEKRTIPTARSARESILRAVRTKRAAAPATTAMPMPTSTDPPKLLKELCAELETWVDEALATTTATSEPFLMTVPNATEESPVRTHARKVRSFAA